MFKTLWRDHRELYVILGGMFALIGGISLEIYGDEESFTFAHEIGYAIWIVCYVYWLMVITGKHRANRTHRDERALVDQTHYLAVDDLDMKYFVVDESDHTTINWLRKLRGKLTVRLFKGTMLGGGVFHNACTTYVVTKKQLFEMRLRGYGENAPLDVVKKALSDEWMMKFRAWTN